MKNQLTQCGSALCAALLVLSCAGAQQTSPVRHSQSATQKKAHPAPVDQEQIQQLRKALEEQSSQLLQQINKLKQELSERDSRLVKAEQQAAEAQAAADKATAAVAGSNQASADNAAAVAVLQGAVNTVKANTATLARGVANETAQLRKERMNPTTLYYKGISLTPGGFLAAETVYRGKSVGSDIPTPFNSLPYEGDDRYKLSEFYGSARATRISLLFESKPSWGALRGYYEADFQGSGTNSNNNQSNSYVMRQRVLYGEAERNDGWKLAFGQMWSLATEGNRGIPTNPAGILTPMTIDTNYMPGFIWTRQFGVRVVKSLASGKVALGVAAENPQLIYTASLAGNTPYAVLGSAGSTSGYNAAISSSTATTYVKNYVPAAVNSASAGYLPVYGTINANSNIANYSFNAAPDVLVKAAFDPGWGHYEVFGLVGFAHETVYPGVSTDRLKYGGQYDVNCPSSVSTCAPVAALADASSNWQDSIVLGGLGAAVRLPVVANKLSVGAKAMYGPGVGRYGNSTLADVTTRADGSLAPIHNLSGLLTVEWNASKRLTLWGNYGGDYAARADYSTTATTGLSDPEACYGSYSAVDPVCYTAKNVTPGMLASNSGTWGGSWENNAVQQAVGYGSRQAINYYKVNDIAYGCNVTAIPGYSSGSTGYTASAPAYCVGHTRNVQELTGGYYYDFYRGDYGRLRQGVQYGYAVREGWSGSDELGSGKGWGAKGINNMFWVSLRYYLP